MPTAALSGGSSRATMRSLNAFPYRATLVHLRPSFRSHRHAATGLTQGDGALCANRLRLSTGDSSRPLMTCPGGGVVVAASYAAAAGAPTHFPLSGSVDAYLGLMPRRHQFGKIDRNTGVSKRGDKLLRAQLFEAAAALLVRVQRALYWVSPTGSASSAPQWPWPERSARCCAPCGRHASRLRLGRHRATHCCRMRMRVHEIG